MADRTVDRARAAWWLLGAGVATAVGFVVFSFVGTVVLGLFVYYAARPVTRQLQRVLPGRGLAAATSLLALTVPALLLVGYALAVALRDLRSYLDGLGSDRLAALVGSLPAELSVRRPTALLADADAAAVQSGLATLLDYVGFLGTGLLHVFVAFVIAFYLLRDDRRLGAWLHRRFGDREGNVTAYLAAVDRDLHNVFFGTLLNVLLTGAIGAVTFTVLDSVAPAGVGIPHPALVGFLTGVASLVPVVGMKVVIVPVAGLLVGRAYLADASGGVGFALLFLVVSLVVVDAVPDLLLRPYVSARDLHTGLVMLAYLFGPLLFGWYGLFLGPVVLVVVVEFVDQVLPDLLADRPIETTTTPASIRGRVRAESSPLFVDVEWGDGAATDPDEASDGDQPPATD